MPIRPENVRACDASPFGHFYTKVVGRYERAAELYLEEVTKIFANQASAPPSDLRPNRTSWKEVKKACKSMLTFAAATERERNRQVQQHVNTESPLSEIEQYRKIITDTINGDAAQQCRIKRPKLSKYESYNVRVR